jgi:hypothetical protein
MLQQRICAHCVVLEHMLAMPSCSQLRENLEGDDLAVEATEAFQEKYEKLQVQLRGWVDVQCICAEFLAMSSCAFFGRDFAGSRSQRHCYGVLHRWVRPCAPKGMSTYSLAHTQKVLAMPMLPPCCFRPATRPSSPALLRRWRT